MHFYSFYNYIFTIENVNIYEMQIKTTRKL